MKGGYRESGGKGGGGIQPVKAIATEKLRNQWPPEVKTV